jgi:CheY-like chemotaxis protein
VPFQGAVPGMSDEEEPGKKRPGQVRSTDEKSTTGRFLHAVGSDRAVPASGKSAPSGAAPSPQKQDQKPSGGDAPSRDSLRREAEASAHILRRLMPKPAAVEPEGGAAEGIKKAESGKRVLLADDDPMMRNSVRLTLEQAGYYVVSTESGEEAWQAFSKAPGSFDLLVSDISMPSLDGASLAHRIRLLRPHMRIILMSGYFDEKAAGDLMKDGRVKFLAKPFSLDVFIDEVRSALKPR